MKKILTILALLVVASTASAQEWGRVISVDYAMGDGESRTGAREAALVEIKRKASHEAGTYIQRTTTLDATGELAESIEMLGASMVALSDVGEELLVDDDRIVLRVTARATIDEGKLAERIKALQSDQEKARRLAALQEQNLVLMRELNEIRTALAGDISAARAAKLLDRQTEMVAELSENERAVVDVFERGTLLDLAAQSEFEAKRLADEINQAIHRLVETAEINASIVDVVKHPEEADTYRVRVRASWKYDPEAVAALYELFDPYFKLREQGDGFAFSTLELDKHPFARSIVDSDALEKVVIRVRLGDEGSIHFPLVTHRDEYEWDRRYRTYQVRSSGEKVRGLILTRDEAKNVSSVSVELRFIEAH